MYNYYLVDGENINSTTTINVAKEKVTKEDIMIIFYTCNSSRSYEKIDYLKEKIKCHVMTMKVQNGSKNSLDFQLVSYLGLLIGDNKAKGIECSYNIVSNDKGYLSTINLLTNCANVNVNLISVKNIHKNKLCNTIHKKNISLKNAKMIEECIKNNTTKEGIKKDLDSIFNPEASKQFYNKCLSIIDKYLLNLEV